MKRFLAAFALTCVLSGSALAGHIDTCGLTANEPTTAEPTASTAPAPISEPTSHSDIPGVDVSILLTVLDLVL